MRGAALIEVCGLVLLSVAIALCALHPLYAVDFFWHLELGEVIASTGGIPRTNLFSSAAPDRPYVQFNWLWELGAAELVRHFGLRAIRVAQALLMLASFGGLYALTRRLAKRPEPALLITALGFVWFEDRFQERPAALVLGFAIALAPFLLGALGRPGAGPLLALVGLCVLWSNLHGGESLLVPLSLFALAAGELVHRWWRRSDAQPGRALACLGVACLALLVSPTFLPGLISWFGTIGAQIGAGNEEWQPAYTMLEQGLRPSFVLIAFGPTLVAIAWGFEQWRLYRREGRAALDAREIFVCVGYLALAHHAVRNVFLSLIPLLFMVRRVRLPANGSLIAAAAVALTLIAAEDALLYSYGGARQVAEVMPFDLAPDAFPELAADFMHEAQIEGGALNDGRWGGYLIWRTWPRCTYFADSRHHLTPEMWQVFRQTHDALQRPLGLESAFRQYGTELAVFRGPTFPLGAPSHYRLLYKAGDQEVYQDLRGKHAAQNLERTRRWLERQGVAVPPESHAPEIPEIAKRFGASQFFTTTHVQRQVDEARQGLESSSAAVRGSAHQRLAALAYRAGLYADAAVEYDRALRETPGDPVLRYQAAQNAFAGGDYPRAQPMLQALLQGRDGLQPRQLRRLQAMLARTQQR